MNRWSLFLILILSFSAKAAITIHGKVIDAKTKEPLIGAIVAIKGSTLGANVSLAGTYKLIIPSPGTYTLKCSFIGYHSVEKIIIVENNQSLTADFDLEENAEELNEVIVKGVLDKTTDEYALHTEKNSQIIVNVMSAKTIQLMPDITVANLLQRFSGVSVDRNASGDAQYAIIRGMPQRFNYTLVNGIKMPSPDQKNRYVPMDLFSADMLDRLEVIKTLTPSMEGDAGGGVMNLVMKDAPGNFTVNASAATGTNAIAWKQGFSTFSGWQDKAPVQTHSSDYVATTSDFSYKNFKYYKVAPINQVYNFSIGDRLTKDGKLRGIIAASYQNVFRPTNSVFFKPDNQPNAGNVQAFDDIYVRQFYTQQNRYGVQTKLDYQLNEKTHLKLHSMFVGLDAIQRRHNVDTSLSIGRTGFGSGATYLWDRSKVQKQNIFNITLQGDHKINNDLRVNWSAAYSKAGNTQPDWSEYNTSQYVSNGMVTDPQSLYSFQRIWQANDDRDFAGYLNLIYNKKIGSQLIEFSTGGLYRTKTRNNTWYEYDPVPNTVNGRPVEFQNGVDVLSADQWQFNGVNAARGGGVGPNTYVAHENIGAGYLQGRTWVKDKLEIIGGVRAEHTYQDYVTDQSAAVAGRSANKSYLDILPSINLRYRLTEDQNLRASYFASLNRPSLFEITQTVQPGDTYNERGNPQVKHSTINNFDLRYEKFTKTFDQLSTGIFYKRITNPIELLWGSTGVGVSNNAIMPSNPSGVVTNIGFEISGTKYWGSFGISGNYTYTNSQITTTKAYITLSNTSIIVNQTRPLQGQSSHIGNLSLLYKNVKQGLNLQLSFNYTGTRIALVSPFKDLDYWQSPLVMMDFSFEKNFLQHFSFYTKVQNILNSPYLLYVHQKNIFIKGPNALPLQSDPNKILVQRDYYGQNFIVGFRYKFSK